jgi:hypothetical protein
VPYVNHLVEAAPIDRVATLQIARRGRRFLIKSGDGIVRRQAPLDAADVATYLLHEDGFLRVPVLIVGDLVVRGYTEALYEEALTNAGRP